ncbi:helix-turn-helix transcriptional regulator [Streptomyces candidus]|uniref:DNA-binding CsgD family transcriptional regulator/tetratricopeptide (TPR) repeat protein n=1 Tax=Streptomyces candidus TaxID=67283 RepID=A0A7X0HM26_9ACTN|nr:LuxR family transcriptional regulator [Streptomyces candidus]MBB6438877.1 DNA-binding CsgD family transcriptional regulator/tetratricopeptide (TPR) repeat protein [Streptomyces candidus]GHH52619.1 helix-turn-helix transcriptional regulator [Streptomyces candidus]
MSIDRETTRTAPEELQDLRTPLRGRDAELAFIEARLDALDRGEGGIIRVEGPVGIGRSRILAESAAAAGRRGTRVFEGSADPDEQFVPLGPLLDGLLSGEEPLSDAVRLRDLATTPGQRFWLLQELGDRLRETARNGPLLVVLDDLQWCDDLTLLTFNTLAAGLSSHAILWLVAVRGGSVPSGVRTTLDRIRRAGAHELALGALSDRAITRITEDVLGAAPAPDVLRVARRAEGVPQLLVELLGSLREAVTIENGTARLPAGPLGPRELPSVVRRLGQLSEGARELVQTAATVGGPVTVALLAELLGRSSAALITAVRESLDADLLTESGDRLAFRHDLIREAVEAGLPLPLRQALRGQAAGLLPRGTTFPDERPGASAGRTAPAGATEAGKAGPGDATEADRLRTAAAELAATAPGPAAEHSLKALELTPPNAPGRPRVIAETIPLLWQTGRSAQARELGASALATGGLGTEDEARIRLALARLAAPFDFSEAARQARTGAALPGISAGVKGRLLAMLAVGLSMAGEHSAAERAAAEAWETAAAAGDRSVEATLSTVRSAVSFHRMDLTEAFRQAERAAALADALGISTSLWVPEALWHALLSHTTGRPAEALAAAEDGIRLTREQGRAVATRMWLMTRSRILLEAGRLTEARADAEAASATTDDPGPGNLADVTLRYVMMRVALHTNDQQTARMYAAQARRMRTDDAPVVRHFGSWMLALMADSEGRPDRAMAELDEVLTSPAADRPAYAGLVDPADAPVLVRLALRAGAHERAAQAADQAERLAALNPGLTFLTATAAHARGLLDNDLTTLVRAVRLYENCPRPLARASALEDAGRRLAATRTSEAVPYFDTALALYARAGAERDVARVRRRLRAAGVRRRPSTPGLSSAWPELTAAELRVVRTVARGLTNQQVAEHLSLSPHTVGSHLRRAFTKLDITSRVELTRLAKHRDSGE